MLCLWWTFWSKSHVCHEYTKLIIIIIIIIIIPETVAIALNDHNRPVTLSVQTGVNWVWQGIAAAMP